MIRADHLQTAYSSLLNASLFNLPDLCIEEAKWLWSKVSVLRQLHSEWCNHRRLLTGTSTFACLFVIPPIVLCLCYVQLEGHQALITLQKGVADHFPSEAESRRATTDKLTHAKVSDCTVPLKIKPSSCGCVSGLRNVINEDMQRRYPAKCRCLYN